MPRHLLIWMILFIFMPRSFESSIYSINSMKCLVSVSSLIYNFMQNPSISS